MFFTDPCIKQADGFKYDDGQTCYGYYLCEQGQSKYTACPEGSYFQFHKQACLVDPACRNNNIMPVHRKLNIHENHWKIRIYVPVTLYIK